MSAQIDSAEAPQPADRYTLLRMLGSGASGEVYLAKDAESGAAVALKKLLRLDAKSVQRFKREFRALTDVHHPSLVKLFDLQRGSDAWFLTMEYVEGTDFATHIETFSRNAEADDKRESRLDSRALAQLLTAFHELAKGIAALHAAGLLHRDLKPSNVMIARDGRVVVLDFGLVRELDEHARLETNDGTVAGTPAYMAPEQALGEAQGEASDWYAFGVMLYQALSGVLPIDGRNVAQLLYAKLNQDPQRLSARQLGIPSELRDLCMALVQRKPEHRPSGKRVLEVLAGLRGLGYAADGTPDTGLTLHPDTQMLRHAAQAHFVGRDDALSQLRAALQRARDGERLTVSVRAGSGSGKTALVEHFLNQLEQHTTVDLEAPLVLRSRCYERESLPFKALDGALDEVVRFLSQQDGVVAAHLLPTAFAEMAQVFPAFQRLHVGKHLLPQKTPHADPAHVRQRAEHGLCALLERLAETRPVVLWIDDFQWGDLDSVNVLRTWFASLSSARVLLILSYRSEELQTSACLQAAGSALLDAGVVIELGALLAADVQQLCNLRLPPTTPSSIFARIRSEAQGNPLLVLQLSALAQAKLGRGELNLDDISVSELVLRTSELLPPNAKHLLDVLAIAGRPLATPLALGAAQTAQDGPTLIRALQQLRLVRSPVVNGERQLEVYHDRVREAVQAGLDDTARQRIQARLLDTLKLSGRADPDWLHQLALGAGRNELALAYGLAAAERAHKSLAFEHAVQLYQRCLSLTEQPQARARLWCALASALAGSRRGAEAADAYLQAVPLLAPSDQLRVQQLAASHLLRTGRFEDGERLVQQVLRAAGVSVPESEAGLYAAIAWERTRTALLSTNIDAHSRTSDGEQLRIGVLYGYLAVETQFYAPLGAALFQSRAVRLSRQLRDGLLYARGLCMSAAMSCLSGTEQAARQADAQLAQAEEIARQLDDPDLRSELFSARTVCGFLTGQLQLVLSASEAANRMHETRGTGGELGDYYYLFAVQTARIGALQIYGHHKQATSELRDFLARAQATANLTATLQATLIRTVSELMSDVALESRPRLDSERGLLPKQGIGILHMLHLTAVLRVASHTADIEWGLDIADRLWKPCLSSPLRHSTTLRILAHVSRARLRLNQYVTQGRKGHPIQSVREDLRALESLRHLSDQDATRGLRARIAYLSGDVAGAIRETRESIATCTRNGLLEEQARNTLALSCLIGGDEGAALRAKACADATELGVVNPLACLRASNPELVLDTGI